MKKSTIFSPGKHQKTKILLALLFSITSTTLFAQQKNLIGIYGTAEWANGRGIRNISGIIYERKFTNNFGIETGAQWHSLKHYSYFSGFKESGGVKDIFTNVPLLFKNYSNIINLSAGPTINILTDRTRFKIPDDAPVFAKPKPVTVGYLFKISKSINIKDQFVLEPEINVGNRFEFKKPAVGIGASFKYNF